MRRYISAIKEPAQNAILAKILVGLIWFTTAFLLGVVSYVEKSWESMFALVFLYPTLALIYWGVKKTNFAVAIEGPYLFVTDGKKETKIPFSNIDRVSESLGSAGRGYNIKIVFKTRSPFGKSIQFAPDSSGISVFDIPEQPRTFWASLHPPHPVAEELRYLVNDSTNKREQKS